MDPRAALDELMKVYQDQRGPLTTADRYFRAEPSSVTLGSRVPEQIALRRTAWPAVRIGTMAYSDRVSLASVDFTENSEFFSGAQEDLMGVMPQVVLESLATGIGYVRTVVRSDRSVTYTAHRAQDGAFLEDEDTGDVLAVLRVHRPRLFKGWIQSPRTVTVYTPGRSTKFTVDNPEGNPFRVARDPWRVVEEVSYAQGVLLMRPFLNRPRAGEPYGRAEMRDLYSIQDQGSRALTDLSVATDAMAVPQKVIIAAALDGLQNVEEAMVRMNDVLALEGDVKIDQWTAAQLGQFLEVLTGLSRSASAVSGVPVSYWGIASEANPASGDSIRENDSRLDVRSRAIGRQWTNPVRKVAEDTAKLLGVDPGMVLVTWQNPGAITLSAAADAAVKLASIPTVDGQTVVDRELIWDAMDLDSDDRKRIVNGDSQRLFDNLLRGGDAGIRSSNDQAATPAADGPSTVEGPHPL